MAERQLPKLDAWVRFPSSAFKKGAEVKKGAEGVAYETKVLLIALAKIISKADSIEEIYKAVELMANAEGLVLQPLEKMKKDA